MDVVIHANCPLTGIPKQPIKGYGHAYLHLLKCLGYGDNEYPVGEWLRLYHGLEGKWLVVTPIHWQASHNDVVLLACGASMNGTEVQMRQAFDVFSVFAAEAGVRVHYHDPYTWLLHCDDKPTIHALPPYVLLQQSIFSSIQSLDPTLYWQRFITEVQMLFAQHLSPSSQINGVWIWGEGALKAASDRPVWVSRPHQLEMASLLSNHVQSGEEKEKVTLLWFESLSPEAHSSLCTQLKPYAVNWYWDNLAYHTKKSSWFSRFLNKEE